MDKESFKKKLKELNISQKEFAERCNIPYHTVLKWSSKNPIPPYVEKLLDGLFLRMKHDEISENFQELEKSFEKFKGILK